jgi:hypothetical protein
MIRPMTLASTRAWQALIVLASAAAALAVGLT